MRPKPPGTERRPSCRRSAGLLPRTLLQASPPLLLPSRPPPRRGLDSTRPPVPPPLAPAILLVLAILLVVEAAALWNLPLFELFERVDFSALKNFDLQTGNERESSD